LCRCSQLVCGADYRTIRARLSLSFLPLLSLWLYFPAYKGAGESGFDLGFVNAPVEPVFNALAPLACIVVAAIVVFTLRRQAESTPDRPSGRTIGAVGANIAIAVLLALLGARAFDHFLLRDIRDYPDRFTLDGRTRGVRISPIPSETSFSFDVAGRSFLHSGFGVAGETFRAIPSPLKYDITLSSPQRPPQEWVHREIDADTAEGWIDVSREISFPAGASLEIKMRVDYADASFLSETFRLCRYYARLMCAPGFAFDVRHRAALWIAPSVMRQRSSEETNVIFIGIDALRADHVSAYGYARETTPNIDLLARNGIAFKECFSTAPWTLPSFFSMMTSTYPSVHKYGTNIHGAIIPERRAAVIWTIGTISPDYSIKTLAEILREQGYYTAAFVNNPFLSTEHEMDRGFVEFNQYGPTSVEGVRELLPWLDRHKSEKFFLFFHVMDPHDFSIKGSVINSLPQRFGSADDDALQIEADKYDTSIHFCDEQMGKLMKNLEDQRLSRDTLVIVTSDHGEELHDRGGTGHGHSLYDELLRVPLIFYLPGLIESAGMSMERASANDIAPTILDLLGLPVPPYYEGQSLMPVVGGAGLSGRPIFAEALGSGHEKKTVVIDNHKLIYTATSNKFELYNIKDDPGETRSLTLRLPEVEHRMKQTLQSFVARSNQGFQLMLNPLSALEMCEGTLTTDGAFLHVMPLDLTRPKNFRTRSDSREILFRLRSGDGSNGISFEVDPPDASIRLNLTRKGSAPPLGIYVGSSGEPRRPPLDFYMETLRELGASSKPDMEKEGLYVWLKESGRKSKSVGIDTKTKEKLEALGYLK